MIAVRSSDISRELRRYCPTVDSPLVSMDFERLWQELVNRPWLAGPENVLGLYGLNQIVAEGSSGREGERYVRLALANMARLKARWTEVPDEVEWQALEQEAPEEVPWLELLINRKTIAARGKELELPQPSSSDGSRRRDLLSILPELDVERLGLTLPQRGAWKTVSKKFKNSTELYPLSFHLGAQLYDRKLRINSRKNIEGKLSDCLYFLNRLESRFGLRGWKRALEHQREIIAVVTAKSEKLRNHP